jgi:hypothetical protein
LLWASFPWGCWGHVIWLVMHTAITGLAERYLKGMISLN